MKTRFQAFCFSNSTRTATPWAGLEDGYGGGGVVTGGGGVDGIISGAAAGALLTDVLPENSALDTAAATLAAGWRAMGDEEAKVLMVVQPNERNVFDQRWIATRLWEEHGVRTVRATLREVHEGATVDDSGVDGDEKTLRYGGDTFSVVYFRAGYAPTDYPTEAEWSARELLERSGAVKSPSAAMHLAGRVGWRFPHDTVFCTLFSRDRILQSKTPFS